MSQSVISAHCINPNCPRPYPQPGDNKFCHSCGTLLRLNHRYIPLQRLGLGGFAAIYTVWDLETNTERVLKVLIDQATKALELFEQEAAVLVRLRHPGIPRVERDSYFIVNVGNLPQRRLPCLVMEKIIGQTLQDILDYSPVGCPEALVQDWFNQTVEILAELHRNNIIHRDIKPSNLMLRRDTGQIVAIDFGGAKQIGLNGSGGSSTRLFSPGYSPPEQIIGGSVGPAADFYALGQTTIHLLTGQYPPDLQDPITGDLRWRDRVAVSSTFADLLDEMVQVDILKRPATAEVIRSRLTINGNIKTKVVKQKVYLSQHLAKLGKFGLQFVGIAIASLGKAIASIVAFIFQAILHILRSCLDTLWEMILGAVGGIVGAIAGIWLAYYSPLGPRFATFVSHYLPSIFPNSNIEVGPAFLMFGLAGLATALGITEAGGFGQQRRYFLAGVMGFLGYGLAWLILPAMPFTSIERLLGLIAVSVASLTLGLGLPSHREVHALIASAGSCIVFASLVVFDIFSPNTLFDLYSLSSANWQNLGNMLAFFTFLGTVISFWLGISYYFVAPLLRFLGWR